MGGGKICYVKTRLCSSVLVSCICAAVQAADRRWACVSGPRRSTGSHRINWRANISTSHFELWRQKDCARATERASEQAHTYFIHSPFHLAPPPRCSMKLRSLSLSHASWCVCVLLAEIVHFRPRCNPQLARAPATGCLAG